MNSVGGDGGSARPGRDTPVSTLLGDDHDAFENVVSGAVPGPLAVVGAPYGGRSAVLDAAVDRLDAARISLDPDDGLATIRSVLGDGPVAIDDCHHLYERTIDGFGPVEDFLDLLATVDAPVVTSWNRYAWAYLAAVRRVQGAFPVRVEAGPLAADDLAELVLGRYDEMPQFVTDDAERDGLVSVRRHPVEWLGRTVSVPVPRLNRAAVASVGADADLDPKDVVFERLAAVSDGNVGVATAIWEARRGAELRPSEIVAPGADLDFDRDEAFCLRIVLAKERVERSELAAILGDGTNRILGRLVREGLVTVEGDLVRLDPTAVPASAAAAERGRFL